MAPVLKRRTMLSAGLTSSSETGAAAGIKVEQVAQAHGTAGAVQAGTCTLKGVIAVLTAGGLQQVDALRVDQGDPRHRVGATWSDPVWAADREPGS